MVRVHAEEHQEVEQSPVDADNKQHMEAKDIRELLAQKKMSMRDIVTVGRYTAGHFQNDKKAEAKEFAGKLLEIKPEDPNGLQIMNIK